MKVFKNLKSKHKLLIFTIYFVCILLIPIAMIRPSIKNKEVQGYKGRFDLINWDFYKQGIVELNGEWEFYWKQLLQPSDFSGNNLKPSTYIQLPHPWNKLKIGDETLGADGYATYRALIETDYKDGIMGLEIENIPSAYVLWVNGELIAKGGQVGVDKESNIPEFTPDIYFFQQKGSTIEIVMQISNYYYNKGGTWDSIKLGTEGQLKIIREGAITNDMITFGALLIIGIYYLCYYIVRSKDKSLVYFGLGCTILAIRNLVIGENYLTHFYSGVNWFIVRKLEYITLYAAAMYMGKFFYELYPKEVPKKKHNLYRNSILGLYFAGNIFTDKGLFYNSNALPSNFGCYAFHINL